MNYSLRIFVCNSLFAEVSHILHSPEYSDIKLVNYPDVCISDIQEQEKIKQIATQDSEVYSKTIILDNSCTGLFKKDFPLNSKVKIIHLDKCFSIFLNKETIEFLLDIGYYILSNGWLKNHKECTKEWKLEENTAKSIAKKAIHKILFLDTGISGDYLTDLKMLAQRMNKPYAILPIGLSYCKNFLDVEIAKWRLESEHDQLKNEIAGISKSNADKYFIFNELKRFIEYDDEEKIAKELFILMNVFFMPEQILFHSIENGKEINTFSFIKDLTDYNQEENLHYQFEIKHVTSLVGIVDLYGIKFPDWKDKYRSFTPLISNICGLSIANVRKYRIIQSQTKQLQDSAKQLKEAIHTKDRFFSIIAHDLRSSLSGLMNMTETMAEEYPEMDEMNQKKLLHALCNSSRNTYHLLDNLLEWSRMERGLTPFEPKKIQFSKILDYISEQVKESVLKKNLEIIHEFPEDIEITADLYMLQSLLRNLISNAVKFSQTGGKIIVSATRCDTKNTLIAVKDNGIGMNQEIKQNIFHIASRINRNGTQGEPSSGLGLILCKEFVEKHGGQIWIESDENKGSTFFFTIPD